MVHGKNLINIQLTRWSQYNALTEREKLAVKNVYVWFLAKLRFIVLFSFIAFSIPLSNVFTKQNTSEQNNVVFQSA